MAAALNNLVLLNPQGIDVTNNPAYDRVVTLMQGLRSKLIASPPWRRPFIDLLRSPHDFGDRITKGRMTKLLCEPTHANVLDYLRNHWPVVRYKTLRRIKKEKVWGLTPATRGGSDIAIDCTIINRMVSETKRVSMRMVRTTWLTSFLNRGGVVTPKSISSFYPHSCTSSVMLS